MIVPNVPYLLAQLSGKPQLKLSDEAKWIASKIHEAEKDVYACGGTVRDTLLNRPFKDEDLCTTATPKVLAEIFNGSPFKQFNGTTTFTFESGKILEVASTRSEIYTGGRLSKIIYTSDLKKDVLRRDLTICGLYINLKNNKLIDHVEGQKDLQKRLINTIGAPSERFKEDRLRMIRAVRLAGELQFLMARTVIRSIRSHAGEINKVTNIGKLRKEFLGCLNLRGLLLLYNTGLLGALMPEAGKMSACLQDHINHSEGDVLAHALKTVEELIAMNADPLLILAGFLHDVGKPSTRQEFHPNLFVGNVRTVHPNHDIVGEELARKYLTNLQFPAADINRVCWIIRNHMTAHKGEQMTPEALTKTIKNKYFADMVMLQHAESKQTDSLKMFYTRKCKELAEHVKTEDIIKGQDLIDMGYTPGPEFTKILTECRKLQDQGELKDLEEAQDHIRSKYEIERE